jgi:hypothetical protein
MVSMMGGATTMSVVNAEAGGRQMGIALTGSNAGATDYVIVAMTCLGPTGAEA